MDPPSIEELVRRALAGDRAAMAQLVRAVLCPIVEGRLARRLALAGAARQELRDRVQEVLVHLLERDAEVLRRWAPERGPLAPYVATVADNFLTSRLRKKPPPRPIEDVDAVDPGPARETPEDSASFAHLVRRLLCELSDDEAALFRAVYLEELSPDEAAARLGIARDAAYKRIQRLRARLREMMSNPEEPSA